MDKYAQNRACPKCGDRRVKTSYIDYREALSLVMVKHVKGKIKRTCVRCGYVWIEEPLDYEEKSDG